MKLIRPIKHELFKTNIPDDTTPEWNKSTTYSKGAKVQHEKLLYTSQHDSNTGNVPPDSLVTPLEDQKLPPWKFVEATNAHKMFDALVSSQSEHEDSIKVTIDASKCDALCLFGLQAQSVRVERVDGSDNVLLDTTVPLQISDSKSWMEYFYGDSFFKTDIIVRLPLAYTGVVHITITNTGTAKCGQCFAGRSTNLGTAEFGIGSGILSYSHKRTDEQGVATLEKGAFSKRMTARLDVVREAYDSVQRTLAACDSTPVGWVADEDDQLEALFVYGYWRDFSLVIESEDTCSCSLEIEGLI